MFIQYLRLRSSSFDRLGPGLDRLFPQKVLHRPDCFICIISFKRGVVRLAVFFKDDDRWLLMDHQPIVQERATNPSIATSEGMDVFKSDVEIGSCFQQVCA